ncbi:MAG: hypothetical protein N2D54_07480 [Chloroflexota bacterium]
MRITQELLWNIAKDTVAEKVKESPNIVCAFLYGSVLSGDPVLGGAADIDLVFLHEENPPEAEIHRLTEDVHVDIQHHLKSSYEPARALRTDFEKGSGIYSCKPMYDPQHFLDFIQASVRGLFDAPDNVLARTEPQLKAARQTWMRFHNRGAEQGVTQVWDYLNTLENIANAISGLNGGPLPLRRFLPEFATRTETLGEPGLYFGLVGLLGANELQAPQILAWLENWEETYDRVAKLTTAPIELHKDRKAYYLKALHALVESDRPQDAVWPMLTTWTKAVMALPSNAAPIKYWVEACEQLTMVGEQFSQRIEGLDAYLDRVEEIFEAWKMDS